MKCGREKCVFKLCKRALPTSCTSVASTTIPSSLWTGTRRNFVLYLSAGCRHLFTLGGTTVNCSGAFASDFNVLRPGTYHPPHTPTPPTKKAGDLGVTWRLKIHRWYLCADNTRGDRAFQHEVFWLVLEIRQAFMLSCSS